MRNRRFHNKFRSHKLRRAKLGDTIRVYVASLEAYNRGRLVGKWLELPMDELELEEELESLPGEEWAIHDFEAPFRIEEYTDIFELNETAQLIEDSGLESEIIGCLIDNFGLDYLDTAIEEVHVVEASDEADLAYVLIDDLYGGIENMPEDQISMYFDYEKFGRDSSTELYDEEDEALYDQFVTDQEYGEYLVDELGLPARPALYFDYEKFGRDLAMDYFQCGDYFLRVD